MLDNQNLETSDGDFNSGGGGSASRNSARNASLGGVQNRPIEGKISIRENPKKGNSNGESCVEKPKRRSLFGKLRLKLEL